jgi:hypothetical protein
VVSPRVGRSSLDSLRVENSHRWQIFTLALTSSGAARSIGRPIRWQTALAKPIAPRTALVTNPG